MWRIPGSLDEQASAMYVVEDARGVTNPVTNSMAHTNVVALVEGRADN